MTTWYRTGTVDVSNGSTAVAGNGTAWNGVVRVGDEIKMPDGRGYEIASVNSNTSLTLETQYLGATASAQDYAIQPTRGVTVEFNDNAVSLIQTVQSYVDTVLAGKFGDGAAATPGMAFTSDTDTGWFRKGSNQLGGATGGVERFLLGTTALNVDVPITGAAVQSNSGDTGPSKLLTVGAFGLGEYVYNGRGLPPNNDLDQATLTGWYDVDGTTLNNPTAYAGICRVEARTNARRVQTVYRVAGQQEPEVHIRVSYGDGTTFGAWRPATPERGSNANGEYVRFADGTQICRQTISGVDVTNATGSGLYESSQISWPFPAAFVDDKWTGAGRIRDGSDGVGVNLAGPGASQASAIYAYATQSISDRSLELFAFGRYF